MEILFISHKYPPTIGGMEKQSYELINQISKTHKVHTIAFNAHQENKATFILKLKKRVRATLAKHPNIDLIHLNDGTMGAICTWLKKETKRPIVLTFHGLDVVFPNTLYQNKILPKIKNYDGFICVSQATADECLNRGFDPKKIFVVANGVEPQLANMSSELSQREENKIKTHFKINDLKEKKILVSLGRMTKRKGFTWFLEEIVPQLNHDTVFILIGPDPNKLHPKWKTILPKKWVNQVELAFGAIDESYKLKEIITQAGIEHKVFLAGKLPFNEVMALLAIADIFVMPNIPIEGDAEGFGLVALEACARGTTVLASGIEGITQAIQHNKNGILLPTQDPEAWINTINKELSNPQKLAQQSKEFQKFTLENYTWQKMANGYVEVFQKIIAN